MDGITEEQDLLLQTVGKLTQRLATPARMRQLDVDRQYPYEIYAAWAEAGLFALPVPEQYGGLGGSVVDLVLVAEQISRPSNDLSMAFGGTTFCGLNLARKSSEEQKKAWLPKIAAGTVRMSISISEPEAGSDIGAIRTTAVRKGDRYILNGRKIWATAAGARDNIINMYARTNPSAHYREALSLFLVPNDLPGLRLRKLDMLGRRSVGTYEITLDNVELGVENLVGGEHNGWDCLLSGLQAERVVAAACDCGTARGVIDMTVDYAQQRVQFRQPIGSFQAIAHMLADAEAGLEAAWALTLKAARAVSRGHDALKEITMAKLLASEAYLRSTEVGMQVMGANGYSMDYDMQRHFRDARAATVAAGSSQMQRNLISGLMGLKVK